MQRGDATVPQTVRAMVVTMTKFDTLRRPRAGTTRRDSQRRRLLKPGKVLVRGAAPVDCLITDLSDTGAKLQFRFVVDVAPERIDLVIGGENVPRACDVKWTAGMHMGVAFRTGRPLIDPTAIAAALAAHRGNSQRS